MTSAILLALMVALIPPSNQKYNGETEDAARARYGMIASAIATEAKGDARLALLLLTVARYESTFAKSVHLGKVRGDNGRSWGLFQIMCGPAHGIVPGTDYRAREIVGVDEEATARAVYAAAVHLRRHLVSCKGEPTCVFTRYGGVSQTATGEVKQRIRARAATYLRLRQSTRKSPKR